MPDLLWLADRDWGNFLNLVYFSLSGPKFYALESYSPATANEGDVSITETIPIFATGLNETDIRKEVAKLNAILARAKDFVSRDDRGKSEVYLYWQPGNSDPQRALIRGGRAHITWGTGSDPHLREEGPPSLRISLVLDRYAGWEPLLPTTVEDTGESPLNGLFTISNIPADQPARISRFFLEYNGTSPAANFWIGLRHSLDHTVGIRAECEHGNNETDTTSQSVAGTSNGSVKRTTFATTTTLDERFRLRPAQTNGLILSPGVYLVLMRARLTASSTTVGMQLRMGYPNYTVDKFTRNAEVEFSDTNWRIVPMGFVKIPPTPVHGDGGWGYNDEVDHIEFSFWAERLTGSGSLEWDAFVTLPVDGYTIITGGYSKGNEPVQIITRPDWKIFSATQYATPGTGLDLPITREHVNWVLKPPKTQIYVVVEEEDQHVLTNTVDMTIGYYPRSLNYVVTDVFSEAAE